jgi:uncharacterized protein YPO0396
MLSTTSPPTEQTNSGYRLARLEVLNWGTFNEKVWDIIPNGNNALLTGDIGSGKSTLVDAITTLLVPHQKITFNKAAGAETRERNLKSYILGAYKNEKVEQTGKARDVYLRTGDNHFTVLLAVFTNPKLNEAVTLAQVFWMQNETVKKFYLLAEKDLSILNDFSNFGSNINHLKKRLREGNKQQVFNTFTDYSNRFRQLFGIRQPEALDLFYQTVSMKSVGNLTDFVRDQMLGQTNIQQNIDELVNRYQELTEAHEAVQVAKEQYELLAPIIKQADRREVVLKRIVDLEAVVEEIPRYFAHRQLLALQQQIRKSYHQWEQNELETEKEDGILHNRRQDLASQQAALTGLGINQRLTEIRLQLEPLIDERDRRKQQAEQYAQIAEALADKGIDFPKVTPTDPADFLRNRDQLDGLLVEIEKELSALNQGLPALYIQRDQHQQQLQELDRELDSLRKRPTQIPERNLQLRSELLQELGLSAEALPFVGELLKVRDEARDWEGAIERQLHGFGLSLLVSDQHYKAVSQLVDGRKLSGKLVYLRTLEHHQRPATDIEANSLVNKVRIKGDTAFYEWLEQELMLRYDYTCCENLEEFRRAKRGLTRQGQSKSGRVMHTKDDRFAVNDRRRFILGWTNKEKIAALEQARAQEQKSWQLVEGQLSQLRLREEKLNNQRSLVQDLLRFSKFQELDYQTAASRIHSLREEQRKLEAESGELTLIQDRIRSLEKLIKEAETAQRERSEKRGAIRNELIRAAQQAYDLLELLGVSPPDLTLNQQGLPADMEELHQAFIYIDLPPAEASPMLQKRLTKENLSDQQELKAITALQHRLLESIRGSRGTISRQKEELSKVESDIIRQMGQFRNRYPDEAREIDADPRSIPEFRSLHERLVQDDIPRHEERFRELLKQGAIRGILSFKTKLEDYEREILVKIESINQHLHEIDYSEGTYIKITAEAIRTEDIITFKQQLRACLDNIYGEQDNIYTEEKFFQVKDLLDRFRGATEEDARWTRRVTDVRQWYAFGADERWREDDSSKEYYTDSSGKSGGQKEKLAYTILASAIAFQFGLEWGRARDRSFRFVVIDEAFGRGSDDSTRYGLQLFGRLNLQLLIVTPLQKINVIEDYIENVHFVSNPTGTSSRVRNISKAEYEAEKAAHLASQLAQQ